MQQKWQNLFYERHNNGNKITYPCKKLYFSKEENNCDDAVLNVINYLNVATRTLNKQLQNLMG
jgi:hypothetical protein